MSSGWLFIISSFTITIVWGMYALRPSKVIPEGGLIEYLKSTKGKGALRGIYMALTFVVLSVIVGNLIGCSATTEMTYFNDAKAYVGLESTLDPSHMCVKSSPDNKVTSNMGLKLNLAESKDRRFRTNFKYTHHSCAFGSDTLSYDAFGLEGEWTLWSR